MMPSQFDRLKDAYRESFHLHGDSPSALLTPKGRNDLRYRAISPFVNRPGTRILDYGCGLGYLWDFLKQQDNGIVYTGVDMLPEFIQACRLKHGDDATFNSIDATSPITGVYDVVFASGVFNIRTDVNDSVSRDYAFRRLQELFSVAGHVLICDFLTSYVDFIQPGGQHFSPGEIADFSAKKLSRRFVIRHDLLPYEFTLVVWRDSSILRPNNIYEVDA